MTPRVWVLHTYQTADHRTRDGKESAARNWYYPIGTVTLDKYPRTGDRIGFDDGQAPFGDTMYVVIAVRNFDGERELRVAVDTGAPGCDVFTDHDDDDITHRAPCGVPAVAQVHVELTTSTGLEYHCRDHLFIGSGPLATLPRSFVDAHELYALLFAKTGYDTRAGAAWTREVLAFLRGLDTDGSVQGGDGPLDVLRANLAVVECLAESVHLDKLGELRDSESHAKSDGTGR